MANVDGVHVLVGAWAAVALTLIWNLATITPASDPLSGARQYLQSYSGRAPELRRRMEHEGWSF